MAKLTIWDLACHYVCTNWKWIYWPSDLMAGYSSWMVYWNDFWSVRWTSGALWILNKWNCNDLSTRRMCRTAYKVSDNMKDWSFMNLYMYQIFSPCQAGRINIGHEINLVSILLSRDLGSSGFNRAGVSFCELMMENWFIICRMSILRELILLQRVARQLLN